MTNPTTNYLKYSKTLLVSILLITANAVTAQDVSNPPELGQETKGTPAISETASANSENETAVEDVKEEKIQTSFKELRRENGQIYQIELNHASGSKQYITETDSDGNIESTDNDIEETPNLPKWKIGSW